jgi:tripartite-type tricarboxylate transporter receptor subunit TctC
MIVPFPPGGPVDIMARIVTQGLPPILGQSVIIENRAGASGSIGAKAVAGSAPDGYTLLFGNISSLVVTPVVTNNRDFDPDKTFTAVAKTSQNYEVLVVHPDFPAKSVRELVAYAKANPGKMQFGTSGIASPHHLAGELLKLKTGIDIVHVPYRGGALSANDLAGGHIPMAFMSYSAVAPLIPTGKIRVLAVVEKTRYAAIPDVPTIGETIPGFEMSSWLGFFAPAGTPAPILTRLHDEFVKALRADAVKERLAAVGLAVVAGTPAELAETVRSGIAVRDELIKAAKIEPQ